MKYIFVFDFDVFNSKYIKIKACVYAGWEGVGGGGGGLEAKGTPLWKNWGTTSF